jgi:hypothetical protein
MNKATLRIWRCRWDGQGPQEGQRVSSSVGYTREGAEERKWLLKAAGWQNVEVYESKVGSDEPV